MIKLTLAALSCAYFTLAIVMWAWLLEKEIYYSFYAWFFVQFIIMPQFSKVPFQYVFLIVALQTHIFRNCNAEKTFVDLLLPYIAFALSALSCTRLFIHTYDSYTRLTLAALLILVMRSACFSSFLYIKAGLFCVYTALSAYVYDGQMMYFLVSDGPDYQCTYEQAATSVGSALYASRVDKKKLAFVEKKPPFGTCTIVNAIRKRLQLSHIVHSIWILANWFDNYLSFFCFVAANLCMLAVHNRVFQLWISKRKKKKKSTENV